MHLYREFLHIEFNRFVPDLDTEK